ncbi:MAG: threonine--tRNA ligase [Mycobacteriales bacterium]
MTDIRLTLDGSPIAVAEGTTAGGVLKEGGQRAILVKDANGDLHDLSWSPRDGDELTAVAIDSAEGREVLRHSTAHVMAQAVTDLFPGSKWAIGPPVQDGFYYDFEVEKPFTPEDVERVEKRMREIIKANQRFSRRVVTRDEAEALFKDQPYKLEVIERASAGHVHGDEAVDADPAELTVYDNDDAWTDLCRGPHLPNTKAIPAFKLMRTAAAYWRGDEKNQQLQRIYGTAWESKEALEAHLHRIEEAERRDHRKLGAELDLFSFPDEIGSGLAVFHPKGGIIRREMENYSRLRHDEAGYSFVNTPHITKEDLFLRSGHLPHYADTMFPPMEFEGANYYLKPMNCPFHILIYKARGRSYRELPLRFFEFGTVYRYEKSGVVHGLTRVRGLTMDDSHIFTTREAMGEEIRGVLDFVLGLLRDFGLTDFYLELSTRDDSDKFIGEQAQWDEATAALQAAADASGLDLVPDPGGAAFYGPKISVQAKDAIGRTWQMSTIQVDFNFPERFDLEYQAADGTRQRPVMLHRALFGSIERFFGVLLEHYAGAMPPWLSPVQALCIPIAERHEDYLAGIVTKLQAAHVRAEVDASDDRMQNKIRKAQGQKVPFMLVAGDRDIEAGAVSFRYRNGVERRGVPVDEAIAEIVRVIGERQVDPHVFAPELAAELPTDG